MIEFREIEVKYAADHIKLQDFLNIINTLPIKKSLLVSSFDEYFTNNKNDFIRYRHNEGRGELTIKQRVSNKNNNERIEVNVSAGGNNIESIAKFANLLGYQHNFTIYKTCQIFWLDKVDLVYYVVYDKEFKELRRFIEIEALEEIPWTSAEEAWAEITKYEKLLEPLGITPRNRMKLSLFQLFDKTNQ